MGLHHYDDLDDAVEIAPVDEEGLTEEPQDMVAEPRVKRSVQDTRGAIEKLLEERRLKRMITDAFDEPLDA